ncbi:DUF423 domain-containing protein [Corticimicrobacter populi]|uniref:DUF423 domain-containing protein n=1 Tax=Corticimicrobacter populi TaxID=2175229 RepID=A0A2V1K3H1_9BURK|nr:DUF423 domain-containing protein [Corticimicrobacter populi]PWF24768.1 DUF423 domain-containing protein [Corticimicrobacter populi]QDQ86773.1 DUF423 domain-containing protein [Alcaligenaceae bacterium SJ-26]
MNERQLVIFGALNLFLAVAAGAFGAHALAPGFTERELEVWKTAVQYHQVHALGLFAIAWLAAQYDARALCRAGTMLSVGIVLFSGSLYLLSLTGIRWLGMITPIGGVAFLAGWLMTAYSVAVARRS